MLNQSFASHFTWFKLGAPDPNATQASASEWRTSSPFLNSATAASLSFLIELLVAMFVFTAVVLRVYYYSAGFVLPRLRRAAVRFIGMLVFSAKVFGLLAWFTLCGSIHWWLWSPTTRTSQARTYSGISVLNRPFFVRGASCFLDLPVWVQHFIAVVLFAGVAKFFLVALGRQTVYVNYAAVEHHPTLDTANLTAEQRELARRDELDRAREDRKAAKKRAAAVAKLAEATPAGRPVVADPPRESSLADRLATVPKAADEAKAPVVGGVYVQAPEGELQYVGTVHRTRASKRLNKAVLQTALHVARIAHDAAQTGSRVLLRGPRSTIDVTDYVRKLTLPPTCSHGSNCIGVTCKKAPYDLFCTTAVPEHVLNGLGLTAMVNDVGGISSHRHFIATFSSNGSTLVSPALDLVAHPGGAIHGTYHSAPGSSGSPVYKYVNGQFLVVAVHHAGTSPQNENQNRSLAVGPIMARLRLESRPGFRAQLAQLGSAETPYPSVGDYTQLGTRKGGQRVTIDYDGKVYDFAIGDDWVADYEEDFYDEDVERQWDRQFGGAEAHKKSSVKKSKGKGASGAGNSKQTGVPKPAPAKSAAASVKHAQAPAGPPAAQTVENLAPASAGPSAGVDVPLAVQATTQAVVDPVPSPARPPADVDISPQVQAALVRTLAQPGLDPAARPALLKMLRFESLSTEERCTILISMGIPAADVDALRSSFDAFAASPKA